MAALPPCTPSHAVSDHSHVVYNLLRPTFTDPCNMDSPALCIHPDDETDSPASRSSACSTDSPCSLTASRDSLVDYWVEKPEGKRSSETCLAPPLPYEKKKMDKLIKLGVEVQTESVAVSNLFFMSITNLPPDQVIYTSDSRLARFYEQSVAPVRELKPRRKDGPQESDEPQFGCVSHVFTIRIPSFITLRMIMASQRQFDIPVTALQKYHFTSLDTQQVKSFEYFSKILLTIQETLIFPRTKFKTRLAELTTVDQTRLLKLNKCRKIRQLISHVLPSRKEKAAFSSLDLAYYTALFNKADGKVLISNKGSGVLPELISLSFDETSQCLNTLVETTPDFSAHPSEGVPELDKENRKLLIKKLLSSLPPGSFAKRPPVFTPDQIQYVLSTIKEVARGKLLEKVMKDAQIKFKALRLSEPKIERSSEPMCSMHEFQSFLDEHEDLRSDLDLKRKILVDFYRKYFDRSFVQTFLANQIDRKDRRLYDEEIMSDAAKNHFVEFLSKVAKSIHEGLRFELDSSYSTGLI